MKVRTRFAPSPTGEQHIGNFRTALYSYMWAKKNNGEFILRVEDTDQKRYKPGSVEALPELFAAYNLDIDLAPTPEQIAKVGQINYPAKDWILKQDELENIKDSDFDNVLIQTQRLPIYLKYAWQLVKNGFAYLCFCSAERLTELRDLQKAAGNKTGYDGLCKKYTLDEALEKVKNGEDYVVRLNVDAYKKWRNVSEVKHNDIVMGEMRFPLEEVDDQVLIKSNGIPTYHLAVVIDDHLMNITHSMRGFGWIPSTPKQVMLYDMLGWEMPALGHPTDILDPNGGKLSKRKGAVFAIEFLRLGYLPDAMINFLMFLGWSPDLKREYGEKEREIFSMEELIKLFDLKDLNKSNPVFDRVKLLWFNQEYIKMKTPEELSKVFVNWLEKYYAASIKLQDPSTKDESDESICNMMIADTKLSDKIKLVQERSKTLVDVFTSLKLFYVAPENVDWNIEQVKGFSDKVEDIRNDIIKLHESLSDDTSLWTNDTWATEMKKISEKYGLKTGDSFMVLRMAVVGSPFSPPLFECLQILGKEEVLKRLKG